MRAKLKYRQFFFQIFELCNNSLTRYIPILINLERVNAMLRDVTSEPKVLHSTKKR